MLTLDEQELFKTLYQDKFKDFINLLNEHPEININLLRDDDEQTLLHVAAEKGNLESVTAILERIEDKSPRDNYNDTPLHLAVIKDHSEVVKLLVEQGANINAKNLSDNTPLIVACIWKAPNSIKLLIQHAADTNIINLEHSSALQILIDGWQSAKNIETNSELIKLLLEAGASPTSMRVEVEDSAAIMQLLAPYVGTPNFKMLWNKEGLTEGEKFSASHSIVEDDAPGSDNCIEGLVDGIKEFDPFIIHDLSTMGEGASD